jgi:carbon monoxide dehydrogenase subunit G
VELEHSFTVPVGIDDAWRVLMDIERVAPCMPGAHLESVEGDDFTGAVKVKIGPINMTYKGKASFVERDEAAHHAVIDARGKDARGNGTAAAKIRAQLTDTGGSTKVDVTTDLDITGKPAQFGRGVMVDVGNKLIGQFADRLAAELTGPAAATEAAPVDVVAPEAAATEAVEPAPPRTAPARPRTLDDVEPIDLIEHAGPAMAKRMAPVLAALAGFLVVFLVVRRRQR